ncbi:hypothetical protein AX17_004750 [Amanita inopinata Kibby_2008]|nr:hypothetical protein AX17_004750 [Amanita inopinata Kibby_2008]
MFAEPREKPKEIVVLGAGVVGLTTAVLIQEKANYNVTIVADVLPTDPHNIRYTSHWAGAIHVFNDITNQLHRELERGTFYKLWEMSEPDAPTEQYFLRPDQTEHWYEKRREDDQLRNMPNYKPLASDALYPKAVEGATFTGLTIDTERYLHYLQSRFLAAGGSMVRGFVQHINEVIEGGASNFSSVRAANTTLAMGGKVTSPPDAVIVCTGLGSRSLGGVEDSNMYPIRGQTVVVRAPWVNFSRNVTRYEPEITYIIPRRSGDIVVGGSREDNDWYPVPRFKTSREILELGLAVCPELAPPEVRAVREPTVEDVLPLIVEEGCGLRPERKGGVRLEVEWFTRRSDNVKVPVVHNYGHGGYGFMMSWASAENAVRLLEGALSPTEAPKMLKAKL